MNADVIIYLCQMKSLTFVFCLNFDDG